MNGDKRPKMHWIARMVEYHWDGAYDRPKIKGWKKRERRKQIRLQGKYQAEFRESLDNR